MKASTPAAPAAVENPFVGHGLTARTYEECLDQHLNPNSNAPGEINLPTDLAEIEQYIKKAQRWSLDGLAKG